ncbi:FAD-binding oxidoreductase [Quadrisphaera sp. KR29]|uniref:FAD-binding oxidoreductase n=1 Tax=Quadrisphaera sp. KR29 TaxID=3461391 RepID=UPI004044D632
MTTTADLSTPAPAATTPAATDVPLHELAARVAGAVVTPADPDYALLAVPWNVAVPSTPLAVVQVRTADDVSAAVRFAAAHGLVVDVRATGHGAAPVLPPGEGEDTRPTLLVHTGLLDELAVHPATDERSGWFRAGAGVRWDRVLEAAAPHGLAPLCGSAPGVGVVGYLTGGGLGPLARTHGFSSDHVRAFEVVTGDGEQHRVTAVSSGADGDLYWALAGGKGAVGVVTAVEVDAPVLTELFGGAVVVDGEDAPAVLRAWARWAPTLPESATTSVALQRLPDVPGVPPQLAGRLTLAVRFACTAAPERAAALWQPMAALTRPVLGRVGVMPYAAIGAVHSDPVDPVPSSDSTALLSGLPEEAVEALLAVAGPRAACPLAVVEVRHLGGAAARAPRPSALTHRDAAFSVLCVGVEVPPLAAANAAHHALVARELAPWATGTALPNFAGVATARAVRAGYDAAVLERLVAVADRHDPAGVLAGTRPFRAALA